MNGETELEMVERHVREGAATVQRQRELIARMQTAGLRTVFAEELLARFLESQAAHCTHLARLKPLQRLTWAQPASDAAALDDIKAVVGAYIDPANRDPQRHIKAMSEIIRIIESKTCHKYLEIVQGGENAR